MENNLKEIHEMINYCHLLNEKTNLLKEITKNFEDINHTINTCVFCKQCKHCNVNIQIDKIQKLVENVHKSINTMENINKNDNDLYKKKSIIIKILYYNTLDFNTRISLEECLLYIDNYLTSKTVYFHECYDDKSQLI